MTLTDELAETATEAVPACNLCGRQGIPDDRWAWLLALPSRYGARRCLVCGLRWISPRPAPDGQAVIYSERHYFGGGETGYAQFAEMRRGAFRDRVRQMMADGARSVLDYGAATGEFVEIAREEGMRAEGVEFSDAARAQAAGRGIRLHAPGDTIPGRFDVIHMNHVLEHVPDPVAHMRWCREHLTTGGLLWIEVPYQFDNAPERIKRLLGRWVPSFSAFSLHHTYFFSRRTLRELCKRTRFDVVELSQPMMPAPWRTSLLWRVLGWVARITGTGDVLVLKARHPHAL